MRSSALDLVRAGCTGSGGSSWNSPSGSSKGLQVRELGNDGAKGAHVLTAARWFPVGEAAPSICSVQQPDRYLRRNGGGAKVPPCHCSVPLKVEASGSITLCFFGLPGGFVGSDAFHHNVLTSL